MSFGIGARKTVLPLTRTALSSALLLFVVRHPKTAYKIVKVAKNILAKLFNKTLKAFVYNDKGSMATIGRNKAVVDLPKWKFQGVFAWFVWMFVHLFSLIGFRNKAIVFLNWVYNYIRFDC